MGDNEVMEPEVGHIITVFRSHIVDENRDTYFRHATRIGELARAMPGYVEHKIFVAEDGERVTLVTFADRASHNAGRDHPAHQQAQQAGIAGYYEEYSIAVGVVDYASSFSRPATSPA